MANEEDNKMDTWSIPRLVSLLSGTFQTKDFVMVQDVLTAREKISRSEIDKLKLEKQTIKDLYDSERLDKLSVKRELTRCKMECKEFGDQVARLREEKMMLCKEVGEKDKEIIDLRRRICEMERSKTKDEAEIESLKNKCKELDTRLLHVEDEVTLLTNSKIVESDGGFEAKDDQENVEKTEEKVINADKEEDVELTLKWSAEGVHSGHADIGTRMLKRKQLSGPDMSDYKDGENIDDSTSSGKGKMKLQEPTRNPGVSLPGGFPLRSFGFENEESSASESSESSESESSNVDMDFLYSQLTQECQMKYRK